MLRSVYFSLPASCDTCNSRLTERSPDVAVTVTVAAGIASGVSFFTADTVNLPAETATLHHFWSETAFQLSMLVVTVISTLPPSAGNTIGASGASVSSGSGSCSGVSLSEHPVRHTLSAHIANSKNFFIRFSFLS